MHSAPVLTALCLTAAILAQTPAAAPKKTVAAPKTAVTPKTAVRPASPKTAGVKTAPKPAAAPAAMTDEQKTIYALGLSISRSIGSFDLSNEELDVLHRALVDAAAKKPAVELSEWGPKIQGLQTARQARVAEKEKASSVEYLTKAAAELGASKTDSGIIYKELTPGTGDSPKASDAVKVHYRGTLTNGNEFDSSYKRNEPAEFPLGQVIPCWTEGVQKMKVGGKSRLVCPANLAYGDSGRPGIPGGAALVFEIELLEIVKEKQ